MEPSHSLRALLVPCALVGLYVIMVTLLKDVASIWPVSPGSANWRFGALGFFLGAGSLPVLGLAMLALVAGLGQYRWLGMATAGFGVALGAMVLVGLAVFVADSRTLLAAAGGGDAEAMISGAVRRTVVLGILTGPAYLAVGIAAWRTAARIGPVNSGGSAPGLVVGGQAR